MTYSADTTIRGAGSVTARDIDAYFQQRGKAAAPQYAPGGTYREPPAIGGHILHLCQEYVLNWDMVAAQIGHESAWWQSRIVRDKHNPSGLGATNDAPYENAITFGTPYDGIEATVAHLLSYAAGDDNPLRDKSVRHEVLRSAGYLGIANVWRDLNGRWAWPGTTYAQSIASHANALVAFAEVRETEDDNMSVAEKYGIRGLIDSRDMLFRHDFTNPSRRRPLHEKRGVIIHYAGADQPLHLSDMELWQSYASPKWGHAAPGRFGVGITADGLQYHIGIGRDGSKHLFQDIELDRWHCGSWPENGVALAINLPIGGDQHATARQLRALTEVVSDWIAAGHGDESTVKGHQEVDWTDCPGTLMADFVLPFREDMMTTERGKWFPETECYVGGGFWDYWLHNGGLRVFGYPLTNEQDETIPHPDNPANGKEVTVQYFERAVFEFHSDYDEPNRVLLRRLGADALKRKATA